MHLTTLVRHWDLTAPQDDLTAELTIVGPMGRVKQVTLPGADFHNGATAWSWAIPHDVKTGSYRAEVEYQGKVIGVVRLPLSKSFRPLWKPKCACKSRLRPGTRSSRVSRP